VSFGVLLFIAAILVVVMVHETGHFVAAKAFGFKATKFFLGFGPTLWSFNRGETEYGVKALPLGGFVKIIGMSPYEEIPPEDESRSYPNKPKWQRAILLAAGSATHWIVAFVILVIAAMTIGFPTNDPTNEIAGVHQRIDGDTTPAADAGFEPGDRIVGVGGDPTSSWDRITEYIKAHGDESARFTVVRDGETRDVTILLGQAVFGRRGEVIEYVAPGDPPPSLEEGQTLGGFLGVSPEPRFQTEGIGGAITTSADLTWFITKASVTGIDDVFAPVFNGELWDSLRGEGERGPSGPVGLVGAGRIAGESVERGRYLDLVQLIVYFTIFVGIMNLLPLPPLDGGHLAVVAYEAVTGRAVDVRKLIPIAAAVISFFIVLFITVLYLDLARPIRVPF
jgi:membrane-associated protease RseP (regulator of RpoE activity)